MTLNEFTTEIAARYGRELDMQYRQWLVPQINQWRSRLIRNSLTKKPQERSQFLQKIHIPLTYGNYICNDFTCQGSFSEVIPRLLRLGDTPFEYLGGIDGESPYRYNDAGTGKWIDAGMTAHLFNSYEMHNNKILMPGKRVASVTGIGIFDEPEKAMQWECNHTGQGCDWWNAEYAVSGDVAADIKTALWDQLGDPKETLPQKQDQDE